MKHIFFVHSRQESPFDRKSFLEESGFRVTMMASGEDCLRRLTAERPDAVLMDVLIDGRNGFEICREIRKMFSASKLPVVLCSEIYRAKAYSDEATAAGAQAYLLLPIELDRIVLELDKLLPMDEEEEESGEQDHADEVGEDESAADDTPSPSSTAA